MDSELPPLTVFEAADFLSYTPHQLKKLAHSGQVPCVLLPGDELRFVPADLQRWIADHRREAVRDV